MCLRKQVGDHVGHSVYGHGKTFNCMSLLRLFGRLVPQILLNRVWEGQQTHDGIIQAKVLVNTNTATWPDEFVKVYLNNCVAD